MAIVQIDARGTSVYQRMDERARERLPEIMATLARRRDLAESRN